VSLIGQQGLITVYAIREKMTFWHYNGKNGQQETAGFVNLSDMFSKSAVSTAILASSPIPFKKSIFLQAGKNEPVR